MLHKNKAGNEKHSQPYFFIEKRYLLIEAASVIFYIGILHHYRDDHL